MYVLNVHEKEFPISAGRVGESINTLASYRDQLWPKEMWPPMKFDKPLSVGAIGGHGPIHYLVEEFGPGRYVRFRFLKPLGFDGFHAFQIIEVSPMRTVLRHTLEMNTHGLALLSWSIVYRPLHDALIEDALTKAEASLGLEPRVVAWSRWVRLLRWVLSAGKARSQGWKTVVF